MLSIQQFFLLFNLFERHATTRQILENNLTYIESFLNHCLIEIIRKKKFKSFVTQNNLISICLFFFSFFFFNVHLIDNMMRKAGAEISAMCVSLITVLESLVLFSSQRKPSTS